jgi:hypothetical protein
MSANKTDAINRSMASSCWLAAEQQSPHHKVGCQELRYSQSLVSSDSLQGSEENNQTQLGSDDVNKSITATSGFRSEDLLRNA